MAFFLEIKMSSCEIFTIRYKSDFVMKIGIDWEFPDIKNKIINWASRLSRRPVNSNTSFKKCVKLFLFEVANQLAEHLRKHGTFSYFLRNMYRRYGLQLKGEDGVRLYKVIIHSWPQKVISKFIEILGF
jgi:hypothetical protein